MQITNRFLNLFFWLKRFLWEACQDLTLIILMVAAVASLALGIKSEVSESGALQQEYSSKCILCLSSQNKAILLVYL